MCRDGSALRRIASQAGIAALLLFVGVVVTRGPAPRVTRSPVYLSRASGQAEPAGASNEQRFGDTSLSGPYLTTAAPASFDGDLRQLTQLPVVKTANQPEPELGENEKGIRAQIQDDVVQAPAEPSRLSQSMPRVLQNFAGLN